MLIVVSILMYLLLICRFLLVVICDEIIILDVRSLALLIFLFRRARKSVSQKRQNYRDHKLCRKQSKKRIKLISEDEEYRYKNRKSRHGKKREDRPSLGLYLKGEGDQKIDGKSRCASKNERAPFGDKDLKQKQIYNRRQHKCGKHKPPDKDILNSVFFGK